MPFIRQTRDKRGFDHTYVMHTYHPGAGSARTRVLYLFRSPANLRLGRSALDGEVMEALEHTHPDLSFDWTALTRDPGATRVDLPPDRTERRPPQRPPQRPEQRRESQPSVAAEDPSVLGQVVGAGEAARLRRRYSELVQRIGRRARTPEERDRLMDRAQRLNPDEWQDEAAVRTHAKGIDSAWDTIGAELPSRRRGRRGGRGRSEGSRQPSAIMDGETRDATETPVVSAHADGNGGAVGPDEAAAEPSDAD